MTQLTLWGDIFIAYGMPVAMFWFAVRPSAILTVIMVTGAFFWLMSLLLSGIIWVAVPPLKDDYWFVIIFSVAFQEAMRYAFWRVLKASEKTLHFLREDNGVHITKPKVAFAASLGFGTMSGTMQLVNILDVAGGPGMIQARGCSDYNLFTISSIVAATIILLNTFWGVLCHSAWEERRRLGRTLALSDWKLAFVILGHYGAALLTLNSSEGGDCSITIVPLVILTVMTAVAAFQSSNLKRKVY